MSDNKWIEQDWERMAQSDEMWQMIREKELEEEYWRMQEKEKKPAKINVTIKTSKMTFGM